jgi:cytochrome c551
MNKSRCLCFFFLLFLCINCGTNNAEQVKFQQYYAQGENIYVARCMNCHQKSGEGLGLVYPPLNKSDFMDKNFSEVICLIKHGVKGPLAVNGNDFNQPMPGVPALTQLEVSELATYIYNTWEHKRGIIEFNDLTKILEKCDD